MTLRGLIEAVEIGNEAAAKLSARKLMPDQAPDMGRAYNGSLDAAKRLHDALLPGWAVDDMSQNGRLAGHPWGIRLALWIGARPSENKHVSAGWGSDATPDGNPARAWLLAILRALEGEP